MNLEIPHHLTGWDYPGISVVSHRDPTEIEISYPKSLPINSFYMPDVMKTQVFHSCPSIKIWTFAQTSPLDIWAVHGSLSTTSFRAGVYEAYNGYESFIRSKIFYWRTLRSFPDVLSRLIKALCDLKTPFTSEKIMLQFWNPIILIKKSTKMKIWYWMEVWYGRIVQNMDFWIGQLFQFQWSEFNSEFEITFIKLKSFKISH